MTDIWLTDNLVNRHFADRHLAARQLADRHLADRHLACRHLADKHFTDIHLANRHFLTGIWLTDIWMTDIRQTDICPLKFFFQHSYDSVILVVSSQSVYNSLLCCPNVFRPSVFRCKDGEPSKCLQWQFIFISLQSRKCYEMLNSSKI
jgi:hypothetical protein